MKIRAIFLTVLAVAIIVNTAVIVVYGAMAINDISKTTTETSSDVLKENAGINLKNIALGIRDSLDNQMANQYEMVQTWAKSPILLNVATQAQGYTKEQLYEMWSAEATRIYTELEAVGDGDATNDLDPDASAYLSSLSTTTGTFPEIFITDSRGYAIAANGATGDFDQGPDDWRVFLDETTELPYFTQYAPSEGGEGWYKATYEAEDGFWVGDVEWDDSAKTWGVDLVCQLRDAANEYLGQLKAVFNYGSFIQNFVNLAELDVYEIKVINRNGVIVATSEEDTSKVNDLETTLSGLELYQDIQDGVSSGYTMETDEDGEEVYSGYAVSNDVNGHTIVVTKKTSTVMTPINSFLSGLQSSIAAAGTALQTNMIFVSAVVCFVVLLVAFLVINAKVSTPLKKLTTVSKQLTKGEIEGLSIGISGDDEIGELGESFEGVLAAFHLLKDEAEHKGNK